MTVKEVRELSEAVNEFFNEGYMNIDHHEEFEQEFDVEVLDYNDSQILFETNGEELIVQYSDIHGKWILTRELK